MYIFTKKMLKSFLSENEIEAGCDEAGRGCIAGPVCAAAVILSKDFYHPFLNDSKVLSEKKRYELRPIIESNAISFGVAFLDAEEIDKMNILKASLTAMHHSLDQLSVTPTHVLIDGNRFIPYKKIEMQVKDTAIKIIKEAVNAPIVKEVQEIKETKMEDQALVKKDMPEKEMPDSTLLKKDTVVNEPLVEKRKDPVKDLDANIENPEKKPVLMINSDCKSMATDEDFLKLRKKMAAQKSDENMIVIARKTFVSKCFSTEQVKNLSSLFLKDEGCYNFFDAAYPHVNDTQNFQTLVSRLTDEYYINRFKAMIRH